MSLAEFTPSLDQDLWFLVPERARTRATILLEVCSKLATVQNGKRQAMLKQEADRLSKLHVCILGKRVELPTSPHSLKRIFRDWQKADGSWTQLVQSWDLPSGLKGREALPQAFIEKWQSMVLAENRKSKPAHRRLIRMWRNGEAIAGYKDLPAEDPSTGVPSGWSYRNLMRREYMPTKFEITAMRIGRSAAAPYRPQVLTTRAGLEVGQYIVFDDFWHDFRVNFVGQSSAQRLLQFHALDLFSGCNFARGMKPVMEDQVTQTQNHLKETEMLFLVAHVLTSYGYRDEGTVLVVEHGTAAIRPDFEARIHNCTNGRVTVERSGKEGAAAFAGVYAGSSKGNFRFKTHLESLGNLIHNETSNIIEIPGQVGSNSRINAPEELYGRERHNTQLLRARAALPPEIGDLLICPFLEYHKAVRLVTAAHDRINARTDHQLEGWSAAGLISEEYRMDVGAPWRSTRELMAMESAHRAATEVVIYSKPGLIRSRKLSPAEVFESGCRRLKRLPGRAIPALMGIELGREVRIDKNQIEFQDNAISPEPMVFLSEIETSEGNKRFLRDGEKFLAFPDMINPSRMYLCDAKGRFVGTTEQVQRVSRADPEALHRAMGQNKRIVSKLLKPVAEAGAKIIQQRIAETKWNARVLGAKKPLTDAERESNRRIKAEKGNLNDLIPEEHGVPQELIETAASAESEDISELL